jgi:dihydrofolate reductase
MRKVTFGGANSLDNYIARTDGSYDWLLWSDEVMEIMKEFWPRIDTIVMGRKTWDIALANAPRPKGKKPKFPHGETKTYVFSRTLKAGDQDGAIVVNTDPGEFVRELKQQEGKDICIMGGGDLGRNLLEAGVIDEIGLNIHPVLLGDGVPLFHRMKSQIDLELVECRQFKNGCVYVLYNVKNG